MHDHGAKNRSEKTTEKTSNKTKYVAWAHLSKRSQNSRGGLAIFFTKWGNLNEKLLNGVISVKKLKLGGKNWILLKKNICTGGLSSNCFLEHTRLIKNVVVIGQVLD
jgi:hypothetical protein